MCLLLVLLACAYATAVPHPLSRPRTPTLPHGLRSIRRHRLYRVTPFVEWIRDHLPPHTHTTRSPQSRVRQSSAWRVLIGVAYPSQSIA
ncbi:hypothetical protein B0H13DRAFT_2161953, partial [Mycena leptocephala]